MPLTRRVLLGAAGAMASIQMASIQADADPASPTRQSSNPPIMLGYLGQDTPEITPVSFVDQQTLGQGLQGARVGLSDNQAGGQFSGQLFHLTEVVLEQDPEDLDAALDAALATFAAASVGLLVVDLSATILDHLLQRPAASSLVIFNAQVRDDALRERECRSTILLHTAPSRRMLADALAQYLLVMRWQRWMLVSGPTPADQAFADALRHAAKRFGGRIVADKPWTFVEGNRRTDTGHTTLQGAIPGATQGPDHDVLLVADEADNFGEYLPDRTYLPRPVAGTHGLVPTSWSRVHEQWGATQLQHRFQRQTGRWMTPRDYAAWVAIRAVGEAALRCNTTAPTEIAAWLRGPDCQVPVFKGQAASFRAWDGQLREPILIAGPRMLVSVSPQPGFLHQRTVLDTLGDDVPDSVCGGIKR